VTGSLLGGAFLLQLVPRLEDQTRRLSTAMCRAPALDWVITYFTILPLVMGSFLAGLAGLLGAIGGQVFSVLLWMRVHEWMNYEMKRGPRIKNVIDRLVGSFRNHAALWVTAMVVPIFWSIRMMEILAYPLLTRLVGFPSYKQSEWVNVSRHKFDGLIGHDLIWCLYCDWMTGVWSLGTEMLRNVESFWCPIRFLDHKKCENCSIDFPDVDGGWVDARGTMRDVTNVLEQMYGGEFHGWFGHRVRLTVKGAGLKERHGNDATEATDKDPAASLLEP